jgi:hypothetical protein
MCNFSLKLLSETVFPSISELRSDAQKRLFDLPCRARYCNPIITKTGMWWYSLLKLNKTKFHENPLNGSRVCVCTRETRLS